MKPSTGTMVRVVLLIVALVNLAFAMLGVDPEATVAGTNGYEIGSVIVTAIVSIVNCWKNNSFTEEAIKADEYLNKLRQEKDSAAI